MSSIACRENVSPAGFSGTMRGLSRLTRKKSWPPTGPRQGQTENKCWAEPADRPFLILSRGRFEITYLTSFPRLWGLRLLIRLTKLCCPPKINLFFLSPRPFDFLRSSAPPFSASSKLTSPLGPGIIWNETNIFLRGSKVSFFLTKQRLSANLLNKVNFLQFQSKYEPEKISGP